MKMPNTILAAATAITLTVMTSAAFAGNPAPAPMQQKAAQTTQHMSPKQTPVKHTPVKMHHQAKGHFIHVKHGDTLSRIAHQHHMKLSHLKKLNHLKGNKITVGQRLYIS